MKLTVGTRIYYSGDMANQPAFGVITETFPATLIGPASVNVQYDDGRTSQRLPISNFSPEYKGHGGTRFVTEEAYRKYRAEALKAMQEQLASM